MSSRAPSSSYFESFILLFIPLLIGLYVASPHIPVYYQYNVCPLLPVLPACIPAHLLPPKPTPKMPKTLPRLLTTPPLYRAIHNLWFHGLAADATAPTPALGKLWFGHSPPFDASCRTVGARALDALSPASYPLPAFAGFAEDRARAAELSAPLRAAVRAKELEQAGMSQEEVLLGMVLLLDQLGRNIFRGSEAGVVYRHYDRLSRSLIYCTLGLVDGCDDVKGLDRGEKYRDLPVRRSWFYMPLMHSEDLEDHKVFQELIGKLKAEAVGGEDGAEWWQNALNFDEGHAQTLERFGRYPTRNEAVGRDTTEEERKYLESGETFGSSVKNT